jgi:hypothetical protein
MCLSKALSERQCVGGGRLRGPAVLGVAVAGVVVVCVVQLDGLFARDVGRVVIAM